MSILRHVTQMRLRKLKSYRISINTKGPGQECGLSVGFLWIFVFLLGEISSMVMRCMQALAAVHLGRANTLCLVI